MIRPPQWTAEQLAADAEISKRIFRRERLDEPLEKWRTTFFQFKNQFGRLFEEYGIADPSTLTPAQLTSLFRADLGDALRYLTGPPISADDLKVLAEASLAPGRIATDPAAAQRIIDTIIQAVDPMRFPWVSEGRPPTEAEKSSAILASAALITAQRVATDRRSEGKNAQEEAIKRYLLTLGLNEVPTRQIRTLTDAPEPGEFCGETMVGSRKADIPVRLYDGRLMPIECKVSNSSTNSVKRLNNDAAVKAAIWHRELGTSQVVPAAALSGVFKVLNLIQAQRGALTLFWAHNLEAMGEFIERTRQ